MQATNEWFIRALEDRVAQIAQAALGPSRWHEISLHSIQEHQSEAC